MFHNPGENSTAERKCPDIDKNVAIIVKFTFGIGQSKMNKSSFIKRQTR